jgi:hypothetical protein
MNPNWAHFFMFHYRVFRTVEVLVEDGGWAAPGNILKPSETEATHEKN